ncbi:TBC1 domain family member 12 isoform X3 [Scleropages formosus]|uniref:TBC1 domain family member 12 n=1 Tax=Scleropages formosus TaxID=113540 RepID=A0A8C9W4F6_SCLFO|nr:TBC1 domain family member 12 isoform X3 [Scleropages formosus]
MEKAENGAAHRLASSVDANDGNDDDEEEEEETERHGARPPAPEEAGSRARSRSTSSSGDSDWRAQPRNGGGAPDFVAEGLPGLRDEEGGGTGARELLLLLNGFAAEALEGQRQGLAEGAGAGAGRRMLLLEGVSRVAGDGDGDEDGGESPPTPAGPCGERPRSEETRVANGGVLMGAADPDPCEGPESAPLSPASSCGGGTRGSPGVEEPQQALEWGRVAFEAGADRSPWPPGSEGDPPPGRSAPPRRLALRSRPMGAVSLSCDATPLSPGDEPPGPAFGESPLGSRNTFESSRRQSAPEHLPDGLSVASDPSSDQASKQKKHGISDFFGRSLFSRKQKDPRPMVQSAPGWKLFGKVPLRENAQKDSKTIQQEYEARMGKAANPPSQSQHGRRKNLEFEPLSTTALILEDRPANLPAKSAEEAQRHRQEYDEMVAEAKKRELKEAQRKKKLMKERFKQEESIANAMVIWNTEILPNWENMRHTRRVRELWWQGLPPSVRGKVWSLAIGNELNITHELYEIFLSRAKERWRSLSETGSENDAEDSGASLADRESSLDLIKLDISRTFPSLFIFQKGGPYHDLLHSVLGAYTCYRPDVGYVQGMSFIAAVLILNLEEADAFIAFANLLNKPCQMAFFRVDHDLMLKYFAAFEVFFEENLPRLFGHFKSSNLTPDLYLIDWIFTLYSKSLPLDLACRVWDVFCRDGEEYLFRTGLGILRLYEEVLLQMDFIHIAQFLTRLPEDIVPEKLFGCIAAVQMLSGNKKWVQVFSALMKDNRDMEKNNSPALKS